VVFGSFASAGAASFAVVGAPKSGTTSLFRYLAQNADIAAPTRKELHVFRPVLDGTRAPSGQAEARRQQLSLLDYSTTRGFPRIGPRDFRNADGSFDCVLTFDDGPHHSNDATIYDILDAKGIRATFFFLGEQVQANPTTALTAVNRGHEVGYHSWDHKNLRAESRETVAEDFRRGMGAFTALGLQPAFFRPPFGNYNAGILEEAATYGLTTVNWTNDSLDWQIKDAEGIVQRVLSLSAPGDIVLLHSIHERTVEALPAIIDGLRERGCRFTSLETWVARATS
ncbi:MAG: polysaccharide deacetylase family protein, partial [Alphaproteobacteria bacterium]